MCRLQMPSRAACSCLRRVQVQQPKAPLQPMQRDALATVADIFRLEGGGRPPQQQQHRQQHGGRHHQVCMCNCLQLRPERNSQTGRPCSACHGAKVTAMHAHDGALCRLGDLLCGACRARAHLAALAGAGQAASGAHLLSELAYEAGAACTAKAGSLASAAAAAGDPA